MFIGKLQELFLVCFLIPSKGILLPVCGTISWRQPIPPEISGAAELLRAGEADRPAPAGPQGGQTQEAAPLYRAQRDLQATDLRSALDKHEASILKIVYEEGALWWGQGHSETRPGSEAISEAVHKDLGGSRGDKTQGGALERGELPPRHPLCPAPGYSSNKQGGSDCQAQFQALCTYDSLSAPLITCSHLNLQVQKQAQTVKQQLDQRGT